MIRQRLLIAMGVLCSLVYLIGCVDDFNADIYTSKEYLLVDGTLTDLNEPQYVSIFSTPKDASFKSSDFTSKIYPTRQSYFPEQQALVKLIINQKDEIQLEERLAGYYYCPNGFRAKAGNTYQLRFQLANSKVYETDVETMYSVPAIKNVSENFNLTGIPNAAGSSEKVSSNDIYVDFDDAPNEKNFYRWRWVNWEIQRICATCTQGRYYLFETEQGETGDCYRDLTLKVNDRFDYYCGTRCWDIFYSSDINILSDVYTNGKPQKNRLAAQIPLRQSNPCLVSLQQMSLAPNTYRYLKLLQDQSINTGTLADTPPAPLRGNIRNIKDANELVLGYFSASSVSEVRVMLDRRNTTGGLPNGLYSFINNRPVTLEELSNERPDIPLAICQPSFTRTPITPLGWR